MVAKSSDSDVFTGAATVDRLWASMPGFLTPKHLVGEELPRCEFIEAASPAESGQPALQALVAPTHAVLRKPAAEAAELLAPFPSANGFEIAGERASPFPGAAGRAIVRFPRDGQDRPLAQVAEREPDDDAPLLSRGFVLRPPVNGGRSAPPSLLMTLWALLFNLSQLTRYHPAAWVSVLDADRSVIAVTLERGLELALDLVPKLVSEALGGPASRWAAELAREIEQQGLAAEDDDTGAA
jgi:hypothetical protein